MSTLSFALTRAAIEMKLWDFGWFDVSTFTVERDRNATVALEPSAVLEAFLRDRISNRDFASRAPWGEIVGRRGPILTADLHATDYRRMSSDDLAIEIQGILDDPKWKHPPFPDQQRVVHHRIDSVRRRGDSIFTPPDPLPDELRWEVA